jgi:hypothetical protein
MLRLAPILFIWTLAVGFGWAQPATVRVAVISDGEEKDFAAMVMAELSADNEIALVERDDLAKVGDELKLQQLASSDPIALGKLLGADGLLFLDKKNDGNLHVRFTAVGLGYVLFDLQVPPGQSPEVIARSLRDRVMLFLTKLRLPPDRAVPLSVINLRSDVASGTMDDIGREMALLLESRLSAVPEYVVLERRHPDALGFEHSVLSPVPPDLLKGAYLIDGSLRPAGTGADLIMSLRVRSPKTGRESTVDVSGSEDDLPDFVEALAVKIAQAIGSPGVPDSEQSRDEARQYLNEAIWDWNHATLPETLQALDNAELLGEKASDVVALRIEVLCDLARSDTYFRAGAAWDPEHFPLEKKLALVHRAMRDMSNYGNRGEERLEIFNKTPLDFPVRWVNLDGLVRHTGNELLTALEASPLTDETVAFRQEMRDFTGYDPLHGKAPDVNSDDLANSAEEDIAFCLIRLLDLRHFDPLAPSDISPRFLKTPAQQQAAFDELMNRLHADPQGRLPWLAMKCINSDAPTAAELYPQLLDELWKQREIVFGTVAGKHYLRYMTVTSPELRKKYIRQSLPLFLYCLRRRDSDNFMFVCEPWDFSWYPPEDVDAIWTELQNQKMLASQAWDKERLSYLEIFEKAFVGEFPDRQVAVQSAAAPPLTVDRFWCYKNMDNPDADPDVTVGQRAERALFYNFSESPDGSGVWGLAWQFGFGAETSSIFEVHLPDMKATAIDTQCGRPAQSVESSQSIYLTYAVYDGKQSNEYLNRYDYLTHVWIRRRISDAGWSGITLLGDQLYIGLGGSGLGRYDWDADKLAVLASSQRRPAQNQFDDMNPGDDQLNVFAGPGGKPCVLAPGGVYVIRESPGPWQRLDFDIVAEGLMNLGRQSLIISAGGEVILADPDKPALVPLMAPNVATEWRTIPGAPKPVKALPPWAAQARWRYHSEWGDLCPPVGISYHNDRLYLLFFPDAHRTFYKLLVYMPGRPDPVSIPLQFLYKGSDSMAQKILKWHAGLNLVAVNQGVCLQANWAFWFIPYEEIDAYIKSNSSLIRSP